MEQRHRTGSVRSVALFSPHPARQTVGCERDLRWLLSVIENYVQKQ